MSISFHFYTDTKLANLSILRLVSTYHDSETYGINGCHLAIDSIVATSQTFKLWQQNGEGLIAPPHA